jgi:hypothetical protein
MADEELDNYIDDCMAAFEAKQDDLARLFGLGTHSRWGFDHNTGILWFGPSEEQIACSLPGTWHRHVLTHIQNLPMVVGKLCSAGGC